MSAPLPLPHTRLNPASFPVLDPLDLVYFVLNVGNGDCQLLLLPEDRDGQRSALLVDVASAPKLFSLIQELDRSGLLPLSATRDTLPFPLVVGTHPHGDHIGGMARVLRQLRGLIGEFWHPGYYLASAAFINMMAELDRQLPGPRPMLGLPTSGTVRYYGNVSVTVLAPAVGLRNRFDTYGVEVNDSSISMLVGYPANRIVRDPSAAGPDSRQPLPRRRNRRILLGADAQHLSWSHVTVDFPSLHPSQSWVARQLAQRGLTDQLRADVLKLPHHGSKHGVGLELIERVRPSLSIVSSVAGGGSYRFPHDVALELLREGLEPTAATGRARTADWDLGIHYTSAVDDLAVSLGSLAVVVPPMRSRPLSILRFGDRPSDPVNFAMARSWT
jgi:hypothetical protein